MKGEEEGGSGRRRGEEEKIGVDASGVTGRAEAVRGQPRTLSLLTYFHARV